VQGRPPPCAGAGDPPEVATLALSPGTAEGALVLGSLRCGAVHGHGGPRHGPRAGRGLLSPGSPGSSADAVGAPGGAPVAGQRWGGQSPGAGGREASRLGHKLVFNRHTDTTTPAATDGQLSVHLRNQHFPSSRPVRPQQQPPCGPRTKLNAFPPSLECASSRG